MAQVYMGRGHTLGVTGHCSHSLPSKESNMPRLPQLGSDEDQWGDVLNEFLRVAHHEDGALRGVIEVINVKDYGAIGDGNADDTAAIRQALAAANFLKAVYFPAGTYSVTAG